MRTLARRRTPRARAPLYLGVVAVAIGIGAISSAALGAPSTKKFEATVRRAAVQTGCAGTCFVVTLQNDAKSQQTLGSANFTSPFPVPAGSQHSGGWSFTTDGSTTVAFRADSSSTALAPGASISATVDVAVSLPCTSATGAWQVEAKQSNDFSGQPGNGFALVAAASDLTPLGGLSVADVGTVVQGVFFPQVQTTKPFTVKVTATDTCGAPDPDYAGGSLDVKQGLQPARLVDSSPALPISLTWSGGQTTPRTATVAVTPKVGSVETGDILTASDPGVDVHGDGNAFDVVDTLCTYFDTTDCTSNNGRKTILAQSPVPPTNASLGLGFGSNVQQYQCNGGSGAPIDGTVVAVDPQSYPATSQYQVSVTYKKSVSGSRPANSFVVCITKDNGMTWGYPAGSNQPLPACASTPVAPCVLTQKRTSGGDLLVVLVLEPGDPGIGTS